jgi:glycosyltransferase involved in cell wall biosynthesis
MLQMYEPLLDLPEFKVTNSEHVNPEADLNYHIPWHTMSQADTELETHSKHVMLYTHVNPSAREDLKRAAEKADHIVAMSHTGKFELISMGISGEKITVIYAGHTDYKPRCLRVGVIGYEQPNGRKRGHILIDLCWMMDVSAIQFLITGGGWDDIVEKMRNAGARVEYIPEATKDEMQTIYNLLDLLLVTSHVEGGPLTVLEACGAGISVLAPRVGYANDLLQESSFYRNTEELIEQLQAIIGLREARRAIVAGFTWQAYADKHAALFQEILCQPMSTPTQRTI